MFKCCQWFLICTLNTGCCPTIKAKSLYPVLMCQRIISTPERGLRLRESVSLIQVMLCNLLHPPHLSLSLSSSLMHTHTHTHTHSHLSHMHANIISICPSIPSWFAIALSLLFLLLSFSLSLSHYLSLPLLHSLTLSFTTSIPFHSIYVCLFLPLKKSALVDMYPCIYYNILSDRLKMDWSSDY